MKRTLLLSVLLFLSAVASAQFYESGRPSGLRSWKAIEDDTTKVIFSVNAEAVGVRTMQYIKELRPLVWYGYRLPPQKMPLVIWSGTALSNGLAMQAPRRVEFVAMPDVGSYSEPWLWQLTAHELRHTVQFSNVNQHTVRALSYLFGEQVELLASGLIPFWMLEGDAVWNETRLAMGVGRGEQPSFSMAYRALGEEVLQGRNVDKWFCGSYRDFVPDHYRLGYQMVKYVYEQTGRVVGNDIADYTSRYPFLIFTAQLALKKHYGVYTPELFRRTFSNFVSELNPVGEDSSAAVTTSRSYTTYSYPLFLNDTTIIALRSDFDNYSHFIAIDAATGRETFIRHTGYISTRTELKDNRLVWSEYRRNAVWDGETASRIVSMNADGSNLRVLTASGKALFPTFEGDNIAWLKYNDNGGYSLIYSDGEYVLSGVEKSYHGLAWDDITESFYMIALSDAGMCIEKFTPASGTITRITPPQHITISDLRCFGGALYYGSVASGQDEVYRLDLATGNSSQISFSRYGAFAPAVSASGKIAMTTYSKQGYSVALQQSDSRSETGTVQRENTVIEEREIPKTEYRIKNYGKPAHLFRIHSWMPLNVDYDGVMSGSVTMPTIGATVLSQNTLATSFAQLNYGYDAVNGTQSIGGSWRYEGFIPKIKIGATWSNVPQYIYTPAGAPAPQPPTPEPYSLTLSGIVYMPLTLSDGYHRRTITPQFQYNFNNLKRWYMDGSYRSYSLWAVIIHYSDYVRMAKRDLAPRWGYSLRAGHIANPLDNTMTATMAAAKVYLPGVVRHHSLSIEGGYQRGNGQLYCFPVQWIVPRGAGYFGVNDYRAISANYNMPVAYPDWGVQGIFFLQRISVNLGADYAQYTFGHNYRQIWSLGGTLSFEITPFRMPNQATSTLSFSLFFPSNSTTPYWSAGFSAPI